MSDKENSNSKEQKSPDEVEDVPRVGATARSGDKHMENTGESAGDKVGITHGGVSRGKVEDIAECQEAVHPRHEEERETSRLKKFFFDLVLTVAVAFTLAILIQSFIIKAFMIPSSSMVPTLQIGDRIMIEKISFYFRSPRRGDIIVFRYPPAEPESMDTKNKLYWPFEKLGETLKITHRGTSVYVKRVVATAGETVELRKGLLYINGRRKPENKIIRDYSDFGPMTIPEGMLFCMGDNRPNSRDSRVWGMVPVRSVIGRVFLVFWPPGRWAVLR